MSNSEKRKKVRRKVRTKALVRDLKRKRSSPITPVKQGHRLIGKFILNKHVGGKKSKTRKIKK